MVVGVSTINKVNELIVVHGIIVIIFEATWTASDDLAALYKCDVWC